MPQRILVTGSAGFIGFHLCRKLLENGYTVVSLDNLNDYYDIQLKLDRLEILKEFPEFHFRKLDIADKSAVDAFFVDFKISKNDRVVNLAAQASVRYGLKNPDSYIQSNLVGFFNLINASRIANCAHFIYASSSSVYGGNTRLPFSEHDNVDHPVSLYAATKKSNELMAHVYSYTYGLPTTGLRFFTVYGPFGRPDMAYFSFTKNILTGKPISVFNHGDMSRDFTYVDDIVRGILGIIGKKAEPQSDWDSSNPDPATSWVPYRVYNIGNHNSVNLLEFIKVLENCLGKKAIIEMFPMQTGDVKATYANVDALMKNVGFKPSTSIQVGMKKFVDWYLEYYTIPDCVTSRSS